MGTYPTKNHDGTWDILWISNNDSKLEIPFGSNYYLKDSLKLDYEERLLSDMYDYKTKSLIEVANEDAVADKDKKRQEINKSIAEDKKKYDEIDNAKAVDNFVKIYDAYQANELVADDTYKGKRYTLIGKFKTVKDDGVVNTLLKEIGVTVEVEVNNQSYHLWCKFDADERDKLKAYSTGDVIKFNGKCISWGNWDDCKVE